MDHEEIYNLLKRLNIPVAYDHFITNKEVTLPFVVYREISPDTFQADGITYYRPYNYEIELVTEIKDVVLEKQLEGLLTDNKIPYEVESEVWDDDEKIYHNFYEI